MHPVDILFIILPLSIATGIAWYSRRYVRSVADFMAGGRGAGRYLLSAARSEMVSGSVNFVILFQVFWISGFTTQWWSQMTFPITMLVLMCGFVLYRYRQTRAMTLAQFFEMRYSRNFRLFAGGLAFFAGLVNFGIIPVIGARFLVYFLGLPPHVACLGMTIQTSTLVMGVFLTLCVLFTTVGGQVTILLTDSAEGIMSLIFYIFIIVGLLVWWLDWNTARQALVDAPTGQSLVNPFDSFATADFNLWYILIQLFMQNYATISWQNSHAFNSSASSPHESRMGATLSRWRWQINALTISVLGLCALVYLKDPAGAAQVDHTLAGISDPNLVKQLRMPLSLSYLMPVGIKGALLAICIMGTISGDGIQLHSWGSIFIQDVVLPLRKKPMTLKQHLWLLRLSIVGVALWAFLFGVFVPVSDYLALWFQVTQTIFVGGAGCAIIGGLYWSRGTSAGAWASLFTGSLLSLGGILASNYYSHVLHRDFPFNLQHVAFAAALTAIAVYVLVSWFTCRQPHNMDQLLHRGAFAVEGAAPAAAPRRVSLWNRLVGVDENFTRPDRLVAWIVFLWTSLWAVVSIVGSLWYWLKPWSNEAWADYWLVACIGIPVPMAVATMVWFTWGGLRDMRIFLRHLREEKIDLADDGTVRH